ncbi:MAG: metallophosphoesterase family protein [Candidatus Aenigmatarchaeota archaeon]
MKIVAIGCIHNDIEILPKIFDKLSSYNPDVLISVGDITNATFPKGFEAKDVGKIFLEEAKSYFKNILVVPGTWDKDLIPLFEKENVSIHGKGKIIKNIGFYGFGGAQTPFNTPYEPSEKEIEEGLEIAFNQVKETKIKIQATHAPPYQTTLDLVGIKHVGSQAVRNSIEKFNPNVAICSHIHESVGKDVIKNTIVLNVGKLTEGYFGLIEIEDNKIKAEIERILD